MALFLLKLSGEPYSIKFCWAKIFLRSLPNRAFCLSNVACARDLRLLQTMLVLDTLKLT